MKQCRTGKYSPIYKILILQAAPIKKNVPNTGYFRVKSQNRKDTRTGSVDFIYKKSANKEEIIFEWL